VTHEDLLKRVALSKVAIRAEQLEVLDGRCAALRDGENMVVLQVEARPTFDALTAIAFENGSTDLSRDSDPHRAA